MVFIQQKNFDLTSGIVENFTKRTGIVLSPLQMRKLSQAISSKKIDAKVQNEKNVFSSEFQKLIELATVEESYFFRYPKQFKILKETLLKEKIPLKIKQGKKEIRILSLGCARGEETYSIALVCDEIKSIERECDFTVVGCDINLKHLKTAKTAVYNASSLRLLSKNEIDRYFKKKGTSFKFNYPLKTKTVFLPVNVLDFKTYPFKFAPFDAVFFRNVLIYLGQENIERVFKNILALLEMGGYLFLGHADFIDNLTPEIQKVYEMGAQIFKKVFPSATKEKKAHQKKKDVIKRKYKRDKMFHTDDAVRDIIELLKKEKVDAIREKIKRIDTKNLSDEMEGKIEFVRAYLFLKDGKVEDARIILEKLCETSVLLPEVYYLLGFLQMEKGNLYAAERDFSRSLYLNDKFVPAHIALYNVHRQLGNRKEEAKFKRIIDRFMKGEKSPDWGLLKPASTEDFKALT